MLMAAHTFSLYTFALYNVAHGFVAGGSARCPAKKEEDVYSSETTTWRWRPFGAPKAIEIKLNELNWALGGIL